MTRATEDLKTLYDCALDQVKPNRPPSRVLFRDAELFGLDAVSLTLSYSDSSSTYTWAIPLAMADWNGIHNMIVHHLINWDRQPQS